MIDAAWVALSLTERVGGKTLRLLLEHFDHDLRAVLAADAEALRRVPGIGLKMAERIQAINLEAIAAAIPVWQQSGARVLTRHDRHYPARLRGLGDDAPPTLFARGQWPLDLKPAVAVVGTRQPSPEAENLAYGLGAALAERGCLVVSGLARGIDKAAHQGALAAAGRTLAVLGCGVLNLYPPENAELAQGVMLRGAVVSEAHPQAGPSASNLVARNRIISGLSEAVIVVETAVDGGAMHTARFARAQGRRVYTFDSNASGNRALIEAGADALRADLADLAW